MSSPTKADLEAALLRELAWTWRQVNRSHFRNKLAAPAFALMDGHRKLGLWNRQTRTISLSRQMVFTRPWCEVVEVLKHEIAHQYVHEVLGAIKETPHGPTFRQVCAQMGIDQRAAGRPHAASHSEPAIVRRVRALLRLADSPNAHEAESAMRMAHRLMRKHAIETAETTTPDLPDFGIRQLGHPRGRTPLHEKILGGILSKHFFVEAVWVFGINRKTTKRGRVLEISGTGEKLEIAEYVYAFLLETAESLWRQHKKASDIQSNRERRRFLAGVMQGFSQQLDQSARKCQEEGLVWTGDPALSRWVRARHPHLRTGRSSKVRTTSDWHAGVKAGRRIRLRDGLTARSKSTRQLPTTN